MSDTSWRAKLAMVLSSGAITLALLWLVGEAAVRYRERHRAVVPGTFSTLFYQHSRLRFALVRNTDYYGWVHVDGQGFRGPPVAIDKQPGTLRIVVAGGSTTFDIGVSSDAHAWPARLEAWIRSIAPELRVEVINAGVPGYLVMDDLIRLETELYRYRPDVIILLQGHNDLFGTLHGPGDPTLADPDRPDEIPAVTPWDRWLHRHSLLYAKLVNRWGVIAFRRSAREQGGPPLAALDSGAARFERDLTAYIAVANAAGIQVVLPQLVHVSGVGAMRETDPQRIVAWHAAMPFAPTDAVLQGYVRFNEVLGAVAARYHCVYVPTERFGLTGPEWYAESDPIHFNDRGADRWAREMATALQKAGVLGPTAPARAVRHLGRQVRP